MTDLQLSLLALGAVIILSVILFNWWQERKLRSEVAEQFHAPGQDALIGDFDMDAEALLKDEPLPAASAAAARVQEVMPPAAVEATAPSPDYASPVADAVSAVAEFEQDMAAPQPDTAPHELSHYTQSWEQPLTPPPAADSEALMQEAGLDETDASDVAQASVASADTPDSALAAASSEPLRALPDELNQQIDLIALLYLPQTSTGAALREFLLDLADLDKPIFAFGLGADQNWHLLTREQEAVEFSRAVCSLQLADRSGQVSAGALSRFQQAVDNIGRKLGAQAEWLGNPDPLTYAAELDQFCLDVDKMVGFHLIQGDNGPFTGTKFRGLAEASGLVLRDDGAFHYESDTGQPLFSVINQDNHAFTADMLRISAIGGIRFQLDIPRVRNCTEVFNQMIMVARQMASSLGGRLVDDNQRPLSESHSEKIRQQLKVIHAHMVARGIAPGSALALRLFS